MSSSTLEEVIIIRFMLEPDKPSDFVEAKMKSQSSSTCGTVFNALDFYARVTFKERYQLPEGSNLYFTEWRVKLGDEKHFKIGDMTYENVMVILGVKSCYWLYFHNLSQRTKQGMYEYKLDDKFCGCCIDECYLEILDMIRACRVKIQYVVPKYFRFYNPS